jgi:L-arabinonolactonase
MSSPPVKRIGDTRDQLGESPVWDHRTQRLYWIDSLAGTIHRLDPATGELTDFHAPAPIGSMVLRHDGGAMLALRHGFARYDFERGQVTSPIASIDCDHSMVRLNDGKVDPFGRFIAGTLHGGRAHDEPALGGLYRLEAGAVTLLDTDLGVSNGPCFSPDGAILYLGDSARRVIWAYDYRRDGPPANKRLFADTSTLNSGPDGATVDADGYLWSVLVRAGALARFAPDGRLDRTMELPVKHPTSVAFGGPKLDILYMTSISKSTNLSASEPDAGGLFAIEGLGVRGLPAYTFTAD